MHMRNENVEWARSWGLPEWVIEGIDSIAWQDGHAHGQSEVDNIAEEMISVFISKMSNVQRSDGSNPY